MSDNTSEKIFDQVKVGDMIDIGDAPFYTEGDEPVLEIVHTYNLGDNYYAVVQDAGNLPISILMDETWNKGGQFADWTIREVISPDVGDLLILANGVVTMLVTEPKEGIVKYLTWLDYLSFDEEVDVEYIEDGTAADKFGSVDVTALTFDTVFNVWKTT